MALAKAGPGAGVLGFMDCEPLPICRDAGSPGLIRKADLTPVCRCKRLIGPSPLKPVSLVVVCKLDSGSPWLAGVTKVSYGPADRRIAYGLEALEVVRQLRPWDPPVLRVLLDEGLDLGLLFLRNLRFGPYTARLLGRERSSLAGPTDLS